MPFLRVLVLRDEVADERLALIHGEEVFGDLVGGWVEGGGLEEEVEDCGEDLGGLDGEVDFDWREFGVRED